MNYPISIAPMLDRTDRHYRYMMRLISKRTLLYSEMITAAALTYGKPERHLRYSKEELPLAIQLAGDDPMRLAEAAQMAQEWGYTEINLNVGCPSDRVQNANFGACLMASPKLVAKLVSTMKEAVKIPVTVKHRIGIDDLDSYEDLRNFAYIVAEAGADRLTIHARKAWLSGLSPKANRNVPLLQYQLVYKLKQEMPETVIEINGGITTLAQAKEHLQKVDAVMIGRAAYDSPFMFADVDREFFAEERATSKKEVILAMAKYIDRQREEGVFLSHISKHMLKLFSALPGARAYRRHISRNAHREGAGSEVILEAMQFIPEEYLV